MGPRPANLPVMAKILIAITAPIVLGASLVLASFSSVSVVYVIGVAGIEGNESILNQSAWRLIFYLITGISVVFLSYKLSLIRSKLMYGFGVMAGGACVLVFFSYLFIQNGDPQEDWRRYQMLKESLSHSIGSEKLDLPPSEEILKIRSRSVHSNGLEVTRLQFNDSLMADLCGVGFLSLDSVVVERDSAGIITNVRIDYF